MPDIYQEVFIAATAETVYKALTTQQGLSAWWTPHSTVIPEPGSFARFAFKGDYFKEMEIITLRPFDLVKWHCTSGAQEWIGTTITFQLQAGGEEHLLDAHPETADQVRQGRRNGPAVIVTLRHAGWSDYSSMFAECSYTWAQFLRSLKRFCETGTGRPWPHQHQ